jgi:ribosomal protein S18 acetylase RimI-like enzyme
MVAAGAGAAAAAVIMAAVRIERCNFADRDELLRVHALQRAAYAVEAEMIGCWEIPALLESPEELACSAEVFWGGFVAGDGGGRWCVGVVATEPEPGEPRVLRISRLAVDPAHFGKGIGRRLVGHVLAGAGGAGFIVSTGEANTPARRLYESMGFTFSRGFATPDGTTALVEYRFMRDEPGAG